MLCVYFLASANARRARATGARRGAGAATAADRRGRVLLMKLYIYTICRENVLAVGAHKYLRKPVLRQFARCIMRAREHAPAEPEEEEQKQIREHSEDK